MRFSHLLFQFTQSFQNSLLVAEPQLFLEPLSGDFGVEKSRFGGKNSGLNTRSRTCCLQIGEGMVCLQSY